MIMRAGAATLLCWIAISRMGCGGATPVPSDLPAIRTASFTFPALASVMTEVIQNQEFDRARGFRLQAQAFGAVAPYYAALARGEVDTAAGGPLVFQRMRGQGIPVVLTNTYATLASLVVIARAPEVTGLNDLKGRTLTADMASSEYSILKLLAEREGVRPGEDFRVLQATPAVGRAHLMTGEADAVLTFEPTATLVLGDAPAHHVIFQGLKSWEKLGIGGGWLLVSLFHEDFARGKPELVAAFSAALQDAADFIHRKPEAADRVVSKALSLKPGVLLRALRAGRVQFDIRSGESRRETLQQTFRLGRELGFSDHLPADEAIFSPVVGQSGE